MAKNTRKRHMKRTKYVVRATVDTSNWPGWAPKEISQLLEQHMKARNVGKRRGKKKRCLFIMLEPRTPSNPGGAMFDSIVLCPTWPCWT